MEDVWSSDSQLAPKAKHQMKLQAEVADFSTAVELNRRDDRTLVTIGDRVYEVDIHELPNGNFLLRLGDDSYECLLSQPDNRAAFEVHVHGHSYSVQISDPKRLRGRQSSSGHDRGAARVLAPMPGKVVRILVELGATVEAGEGVVVVEAMKMQNEMKAPKTGTVTSLIENVGTPVNAGEVLAIIE